MGLQLLGPRAGGIGKAGPGKSGEQRLSRQGFKHKDPVTHLAARWELNRRKAGAQLLGLSSRRRARGTRH